MRPEPGDQHECTECGTQFEIPYPPTDTIYVPRCVSCGEVVAGYEESAELERKAEHATELIETIDRRLSRIRDRMNQTADDIPPTTGIKAVGLAAHEISELDDFLQNELESW